MLRDFYFFFINPQVGESPIYLNLNKSILLITKMILFYYGLSLLTMTLFLPILKYLDLFPQKGLRLSQIPLSFKLIFFVPIIEETVFRLSLKFSKQNIFLSLAALQFILLYHTYSLFFLIIISLTIALIPYMRLIPETFYSRLGLIWKNYFPLVYYGLALCFGLVHLSNFQNLRIAHYLLFPLIVSNQIIMGLIFGYVRVTFKNGFIYSILLHFLINLPFFWIAHL